MTRAINFTVCYSLRSISINPKFPKPLKKLYLHFYTTDNATQNQEAYNTFIDSFIPLLASVPCPKFAIYYGSEKTKKHGQYKNPYVKLNCKTKSH